jgi:hypothetical protein
MLENGQHLLEKRQQLRIFSQVDHRVFQRDSQLAQEQTDVRAGGMDPGNGLAGY